MNRNEDHKSRSNDAMRCVYRMESCPSDAVRYEKCRIGRNEFRTGLALLDIEFGVRWELDVNRDLWIPVDIADVVC